MLHHYKNIQTRFINMLKRLDSTERELLERQLAMKDIITSYSWTTLIRKLFNQYHLPSPYQLLSHPSRKSQWKVIHRHTWSCTGRRLLSLRFQIYICTVLTITPTTLIFVNWMECSLPLVKSWKPYQLVQRNAAIDVIYQEIMSTCQSTQTHPF